jgi:magnesium transporter
MFRRESVPARVQIVRYSPHGIETTPIAGLEDIAAPVADGELLWIDVAGIDDPEVLRAGGKRFGLSDLAMENIVNVPQRPKTEMLDGKLLSISHVLKVDSKGAMHIDQLSVVLGPNYVITVHSQADEFLDPIRQRLQSPESRLRQRGADYLAYAVIDTVVDGYYPVLEALGERLEQLEDEALENPQPEVLKGIHRLRTQLIQVRRSSWPMRESLETLLHADTPLISDSTHSFLGDAHSHCAQTVDVVEMYRESAGALVSTYMSSVAHRSNEVMKVLTMVSSIFVPMTFLAGVYGMNFEHMPELSHPWSYPLALTAMLASAIAMVVFFARRGWFGPASLRVGATTDPSAVGIDTPEGADGALRSVAASDLPAGKSGRAKGRPIQSRAA